MSVQKVLPQQQQSPDVQQADAPKGIKTFGLTKLGFTSFDELIQKSAQEFGVEYEIFFSNSVGTQHGYMKVVSGKVVRTLPLIEFCVLSAVPVVQKGVRIGYIVKHFRNNMAGTQEEFVPIVVLDKRKLCKHFKLPPQANKRKEDLCERLVQTLVLEKAFAEKPIEVGLKQGWSLVSEIYTHWESKERYPPVLHGVIPASITNRESPRFETMIYAKEETRNWKFHDIFNTDPNLKVPFLIRESSYMLSLASRFGVYCDQIILTKPNDRADFSLLTALYDNVSYGRGRLLTLSNGKGIDQAGEILNDAVLLICDDTKPDEERKREKGIDALHKRVLDARGDFLQIPVVLSGYVSTQFRHDLYCDFSELDGAYDISPAVLTELLEHHDAVMLKTIESRFSNFLEMFNRHIIRLSRQTPYFIPPQRRNLYYLLLSTLRTYDEFFGVFFDEETELRVVDILSTYDDTGESNDDLLLTAFGKCLNEEIGNDRYHFIRRTKYIIIDTGTYTVIVDDDYIYFETDIIKELALSKMKLHSVNSVTDILKAYSCLAINDHNSKCYRFHVQNSNGEPYILYTYGISKKLINAENRRRLDLADYQKFLLGYEDFENNDILPLGETVDGHYVGKDVSYRNKSNDSIFITGQSGRGKSFYATNILPSLVMLGSRMLVFDVSQSFTRDEVLRALPEEVVNELFEFIDIGSGQRKLPVNPLYIGDCANLPAKKRRIMGLIKAVAKLDKEETKITEGIISDMLKKAPMLTVVSTESLQNTLKRGGKIGNKVWSLISSTLDDIENMGFEEQGWDEFFEKSKRIPVILLGDEVDSKIHTVLDVLVSSVFTWQRDHNNTPLSVVVDEIKMQNFSEGSPLHTILTQGRKFDTRLIGMTLQYISTGSHAVDVMKEADVKIYFKPINSLDRIAAELEYNSPADASFSSMGIGDFILSCDAFNKVDEVNEHLIIHCKTLKFVDSPLYNRFKADYHLT